MCSAILQKGIIAECPYVKASDILVKVAKGMGFPEWFSLPFTWLGARIFGHFNVNETDAVKAVKQSRVPILIIHGEADTLVPQEMSELAQQANPKLVQRVTFPGAGHAMSYLVDTERYWKVTTVFMNNVLS